MGTTGDCSWDHVVWRWSLDLESRHERRVLLVDDEPNVTSALTRSLRREPYELSVAQSAEEALDFLEGHEIDVIVSDHAMPGLSGAQLLSMARQMQPTAARILLTGNADLPTAVTAINRGEVFRFLVKPCGPLALKLAIEEAIRHRQVLAAGRRLLQIVRDRTSPDIVGPSSSRHLHVAGSSPAEMANLEEEMRRCEWIFGFYSQDRAA